METGSIPLPAGAAGLDQPVAKSAALFAPCYLLLEKLSKPPIAHSNCPFFRNSLPVFVGICPCFQTVFNNLRVPKRAALRDMSRDSSFVRDPAKSLLAVEPQQVVLG